MMLKRFTETLTAESATTLEDLQELYEEYAEIAFFLALNAGAMERKLEEEGPIRDGDECLNSAALGLAFIAEILSDPEVQRRACRHYRSLLRYYPDSKYADEARSSIGELNC